MLTILKTCGHMIQNSKFIIASYLTVVQSHGI